MEPERQFRISELRYSDDRGGQNDYGEQYDSYDDQHEDDSMALSEYSWVGSGGLNGEYYISGRHHGRL